MDTLFFDKFYPEIRNYKLTVKLGTETIATLVWKEDQLDDWILNRYAKFASFTNNLNSFALKNTYFTSGIIEFDRDRQLGLYSKLDENFADSELVIIKETIIVPEEFKHISYDDFRSR